MLNNHKLNALYKALVSYPVQRVKDTRAHAWARLSVKQDARLALAIAGELQHPGSRWLRRHAGGTRLLQRPGLLGGTWRDSIYESTASTGSCWLTRAH